MVTEETELAQLQLERAQLRSLIDTLPDLVWLKDPDGVYLACNELFGQFYGAPTANILGRTDYDFTSREQADFFRENDLAAVAAGKSTMNEEWITYASDGRRELLETIKTPMHDVEGKLIGVLGIGRNITQRDRASKRLQRTIDTVEALIVQLDSQGAVTLINRRAITLLGIESSETLGQDWFALSCPEDEVERHRRHVLDFLRSSPAQVEEGEIPLVTAEGVRSISWTFRKLEDSAGQTSGCLCAGIDITRRLEAAEKSRLASVVFQQAQEGILVCDTEERIIQVNPAFTKITGYVPEEVIGLTPRCLASGRHTAAEYAEMWREIFQEGSWTGELWNRHRSGSPYLTRMTVSVVRDHRGGIANFLAVMTDVTVAHRQQERLRSLAHHDSLTGLPNRALLLDRLEQALARSRRDKTNLAVCFIDLDNFKPVNDSFGHDIGDELLMMVARRLRSVPREADTVARHGGDEFVVILNDVGDQESCAAVARRLLDALAQPAVVSGHQLEICASMGVTLHPNDGADPAMLLRHADLAMYQAKLGGKNQIRFFDSDSDAMVHGQSGRSAALRRALSNAEIVLHFQPVMALGSDTIVGCEALLRWADPERGVLAAGMFLPDVTDSALVVELDHWVIKQALDINVNLNGATLQRHDFVYKLGLALQAHPELPPGSLILEVVESVALGDLARLQSVFGECRQLGVRIALDDFGTGYSSLTYFRRLPVDVIKIDRSYVTDLNGNREALAIVASVTSLAKALGRLVVAEGVEDRAVVSTLKELGCDAVQGYAVARPMDAETLVSWLRSRNM